MRCVMSSMVSNTTARPSCVISFGVAADCLMTAPRGARLPRSTHIAPCALIGFVARADDGLPRHLLGDLDVIAQRADDRRRIEIENVGQLLHQPRHAAGMMEVLHVVIARRLQVDQHRHLLRQRVERIEIERDAGAPRHRGEMHDAVGRAADRLQHDQRIAQARAR